MNKMQANLQDLFLNQVRKENVGVMIYLIGGVQLRGNVRGFDSFTILLDTPGKPVQLVYKHAITSIVPMRPIQNLYAETLRDAESLRDAGAAAQTVTAAHPDAAVTVQSPAPMPASETLEAAQAEPLS